MLWIVGLITFSMVFPRTMCQYGSECRLPNRQIGHCLPVVSCKPLHDFFEMVRAGKVHITPSYAENFQKLHCGSFDNVPYACCSDSDTQLNPNGLNILKNQNCGRRIDRRISHGREVVLSSLPWMALLVYDDTHDPYQCGGALISERYILTAAHCIKDNLYQVRLGEHRISTDRDCIHNGEICAPPVEDVGIEEKIIHSDYRNGVIGNDVALIRLNRKVESQEHIKPICLPIYDAVRSYVAEKYIISGWGKTDKASTSDVLMAVVVPLVERNECQQILQIRNPLTYASVCAGNINLADGCNGDSGGPLAYISHRYDELPRVVQAGVLSVGKPNCGSSNAPSIYMNVSHYLQWMTDNIKE